MGEHISIGDSLIITLFSISMVFIVLVFISMFISLLKNLDRKEQSTVKKEIKKVPQTNKELAKTEEKVNTVDDEELVAVISAAIAASLGASLPEINIKKINRISGNSTAWSVAGRQEQIYNKL